jgi:hypothetical protein
MNVSILVNSFTSGELSPLLAARIDTPTYATGAKRMENCIPMITGGVRKRPGTRYLRNTSDGKRVVLIDWLQSNGTSVLVEMSVVDSGETSLLNFRVYDESDTLINETQYYDWTNVEEESLEKLRYAVGKGVVPGKTAADFILFTSEEIPDMFVLQPGGSGNYETAAFKLNELYHAGHGNSVTYGAGVFVAVDSNTILYSTEGTNWMEVPLPGIWNVVKYVQGKFFAGGNNVIAWSADGAAWNKVSISGSWTDFTYGDGKFLAVSSSIFAFSSDGITWTVEPMDSSGWVCAAFALGKFHVNGNEKTAISNPDRIAWRTATMPTSANWRAIAYGNGKYVALVYNSNRVAYSADGINWTLTTLPISGNWKAITYGNGRFVAVPSSGNICVVSDEGIYWFARDLPTNGLWDSIAYGDGKFVAVDSGSTVRSAYSDDGNNWTAGTLPDNQEWDAIAFGGGKFVIMGDGEALYSTDGINWTKATTFPVRAYFVATAYGAGKFVSVSSHYGSVYSVDGITWEAGTLSNIYEWTNIAYGNGKFVAVSKQQKEAYSTDGINWTIYNMRSSGDWYAFIFGGDKFVALAYNSNNELYSINSMGWDIYSSIVRYSFMIFANGCFVAVITNGFSRSTNGNDWRIITVPGQWKSIAYGNGKFVAVGINIIAASSDGNTWAVLDAAKTPAGNWYGVTYGNNKFTMVSDTQTATSADGLTWEIMDIKPPSNIKDVAFYGGRLVLGGLAASTGSSTRIMLSKAPDSVKGNYRYDEFGGGPLAGDAITLDENDMGGAGIQWIFTARRFLAATERTSWSDTGAVPTPADFDMNIIEYVGANRLKPAASKEIVVYAGRGGKSLRALVWQYQSGQGGYADVDISSQAAHLFDSGIVSYAIMDFPFPMIWIVNGAGELISCMINMQSGIIGFARHSVGNIQPTEENPFYGIVERVEVARRLDGDKLYMVVRRRVLHFLFVMVGIGKIAYSGDGVTWIKQALGRSWRAVCYGNGLFVAVGSSDGSDITDEVATSTDGINWTVTALPANIRLNAVTYGNGKFVAVGNGSTAYSTDGINWTAFARPSNDRWRGVCYGDGRFVAVGDGTPAAYSDDGITWTKATMPLEGNWTGVTYGNGRFVAVDRVAKTAYSDDGITWTATANTGILYGTAVTYGNGKFVATAYNSRETMYSTDGINWTVTALPANIELDSVTYGNGKFVAVGYKKSAYSPDGINWTIQEHTEYWMGVTCINENEKFGDIRTIETLEVPDLINADFRDSYYVDSGVIKKFSEASDVIDGLSHLAGQEVSVFADGAFAGRKMVNGGGTVRLDHPVMEARAGLPVKTRLSLNTSQIPANGTSFGKKRRIEKVILNLYKSIGGGCGTKEENGEAVITQRFGVYRYGEPVEPFTGNVELYVSGTIDTEGALFIEHDEPVPFTALAVVERIAILEA